MSSLLEQAIIDANMLREAALKNAEKNVLEKYSQDVKKAFDLFVVEENELIEYTKINEFSFIIRKK